MSAAPEPGKPSALQAGTSPDGRQYIRTHVDALKYLIKKSEFDQVAAFAVHQMHLDLLENIKDKEAKTGETVGCTTVDKLVDDCYSAAILDRYKVQAIERFSLIKRELLEKLLVEHADLRLKAGLGPLDEKLTQIINNQKLAAKRKVLPWYSAWQGVCGNILSALIGFMAFAAITIAADTGFEQGKLVKSAVNFYNRCFVAAPAPSAAQPAPSTLP